jgi:hypothetical protein
VNERVERIVFLQQRTEADQWEAARLIFEELESGKTQRELAGEIGKSLAHVSYMAATWRRSVHLGEQDRPAFNEAYHDRQPENPRDNVPAFAPDNPEPEPAPERERHHEPNPGVEPEDHKAARKELAEIHGQMSYTLSTAGCRAPYPISSPRGLVSAGSPFGR